MKKILFIIIVTVASSVAVNAQQIHQLSNYMVNDFAFNPAVAGSDDQVVSRATFRKQWAGFEGSPTTTMVSMHGNLRENKAVGLGGLIYADATGPTRRIGVQAAYAYHLPINPEKNTYLGFGIAGSMVQYSIDFEELILKDELDPQLASTDQSKIGADAHLGVYLKGDNFWAGISANQLFASRFKYVGDIESIQNNMHLYITGGYRFNASDNFDIAPGALIKVVQGANVQAELNARGIYKNGGNDYWLGLGYRTEDAMSILLGLDLGMGLNLIYAYDLTTSNLNTVSNGSHEITLGFNFGGPGSRTNNVITD